MVSVLWCLKKMLLVTRYFDKDAFGSLIFWAKCEGAKIKNSQFKDLHKNLEILSWFKFYPCILELTYCRDFLTYKVQSNKIP